MRAFSALVAGAVLWIVGTAGVRAQAPDNDPTTQVRVFTAEDIQRSGAKHLPEAMRFADPDLTQANAAQWAISARSLDALDGIDLLTPSDNRVHYRPRVAGAFWNAQQSLLQDIERIEIVTPTVPGWGTSDVNGVVRITTKSAAETQGLQVEGLDGTSLGDSGGVRYGGALTSNFGYRVYAKYFGREDAVLPDAAEVADSWRMAQSGFRADGQLSERDSLSMQGGVYQGRTAQVDVSGANVSMLWAREVREDSNLELHLLYDHTRGNAEELETYDLNLQHRIAMSQRNRLSWGLGVHDAMASGFIQNDLSLAQDKVRVSVGTTIEHDEEATLGVRPNGRLSWKPSGLQTVWAAASQSVNQITAYEVGYRVQPQPALSVSMASFYSAYGRTTNFETPEDAYGTAVTADFQATSRWKLSASRTAIHSPATEVPQSPRKLLSLTSSLDLPAKKTQVNATYRRAIRSEGVEGTQAWTGYDELEVRLAWRPRSALELSLSGRNLLNDQRAQIAPFAAGIAGAPPEGRAAQANLAWSF